MMRTYAVPHASERLLLTCHDGEVRDGGESEGRDDDPHARAQDPPVVVLARQQHRHRLRAEAQHSLGDAGVAC